MRSEISGVEGSRKEERDLMGGRHSGRILRGRFETRFRWMVWILSMKNDSRELQKAVE